jgi:antitoxin VapB
MPLSIKNQETEATARKLADLTGESLTEAVRVAVEERYERLSKKRAGRSRLDALNEIALRCSSRPVVSTMNADEVLGYDELGIPTR